MCHFVCAQRNTSWWASLAPAFAALYARGAIHRSVVDRLLGDAGDDYVDGQAGDDVVVGGAGKDIVSGGDGADFLVGDWQGGDYGEDDYIYAGNGDDVAIGDGGNDDIMLDFGNDKAQGGAGDDYISGGYGNDLLQGQSGNDQLDGDMGNDTLIGGTGDDIFMTGRYLYLGDDNDRVIITTLSSNGALLEASGADYAYIDRTKNDTFVFDHYVVKNGTSFNQIDSVKELLSYLTINPRGNSAMLDFGESGSITFSDGGYAVSLSDITKFVNFEVIA
jgi:Ca2+-binding RTX toxin-like protein